MFQYALPLYEKQFGSEHTKTVNVLRELGGVYADLGKRADAKRMFMRALDGSDTGERLKITLIPFLHLGWDFSRNGELDEAMEIVRRAMEAARGNTLDATYTTALELCSGIGVEYLNAGNPAEAEKCFNLALKEFTKKLGPEHRDTLIQMGYLGSVYSQQGRLEESEKIYRRAVQGMAEVFNQDDAFMIDTKRRLENVRNRLGCSGGSGGYRRTIPD